ncbi:hypothetical protein FB451DRAFT_1182654 [Mycena latifolia]|nr:hypothetical protein FB451DRAFT_1182654 [Mycena latifolia]
MKPTHFFNGEIFTVVYATISALVLDSKTHARVKKAEIVPEELRTRRTGVHARDIELVRMAHQLGLFQVQGVIQGGRAQVPDGASAVPTVCTTMCSDRPGQKSIRVNNFAFTWYKGKTKYTTYSPFTAMPDEGWQTATRETAGADVREDVNKTMLGLYSFRVFVDCVWLAQKVGDTVPLGRCPVLSAGTSIRKRPRIEDIAKTAAPKKRRGFKLGVGKLSIDVPFSVTVEILINNPGEVMVEILITDPGGVQASAPGMRQNTLKARMSTGTSPAVDFKIWCIYPNTMTRFDLIASNSLQPHPWLAKDGARSVIDMPGMIHVGSEHAVKIYITCVDIYRALRKRDKESGGWNEKKKDRAFRKMITPGIETTTSMDYIT